jgi:two-component system cell cycle response regulator
VARILIIEDNPDNLDLLSYLLDAYGHTVLSAPDGESGIETARRERPDLIACDIHLPGLDGYAVASTLKADPLLAATPVVAVTALAMVGDREKILAADFDGYITKPIDPHLLVAQVDAFLHPDQRGTAPHAGHANVNAPEQPARAKDTVILVVDDSPTNCELIYQTLSPCGYDVRIAADVPEAIAKVQGLTPDLILSDLHMPGEDGFDLIRRVKRDPRLANVPFVFLSSSVWGENERDTAVALGVTRFLLRPIEPHVLIDEIARCLPAREGASDGEDPRR